MHLLPLPLLAAHWVSTGGGGGEGVEGDGGGGDGGEGDGGGGDEGGGGGLIGGDGGGGDGGGGDGGGGDGGGGELSMMRRRASAGHLDSPPVRVGPDLVAGAARAVAASVLSAMHTRRERRSRRHSIALPGPCWTSQTVSVRCSGTFGAT